MAILRIMCCENTCPPHLLCSVRGAEMTKDHGWCHTGCQPGPHSWWRDTAWQVQSLLSDKTPQTTCPMSCCQSDYTVFICLALASAFDMKMNPFFRASVKTCYFCNSNLLVQHPDAVVRFTFARLWDLSQSFYSTYAPLVQDTVLVLPQES